MSKLFLARDCSMLEINPLVLTADNRLLGLDAKMSFDDNALFRHPDLTRSATWPKRSLRRSAPARRA